MASTRRTSSRLTTDRPFGIRTMESGIGVIRHDSRRMRGRDPHETHRAATPLELLFDLTFATSFGLAASEVAPLVAEGHFVAGLAGFGFASFAICSAWINFSWLSSAYDTDDWVFRLVTMVQMIGVMVLAAGVPRMFASIERSRHRDNSVMVLGYVIMRLALVFQWLRAAKDDPARRRVCLTYAATISIAQVGWVVQIVVPLAAPAAIILGGILVLVEMTGPVLAERQAGGTPITVPSGTASLPSSRLARASSARWRRCRPWSTDRAGLWMPCWSASRAWGSPSACGGSITSCLLGRSSSDTAIERRSGATSRCWSSPASSRPVRDCVSPQISSKAGHD